MRNHMNKNGKIWLILVVIVAIALLTAFLATRYPSSNDRLFQPRAGRPPPPRPPPPGDIELFYTVKTVISSINAALLVVLLGTYINIYLKTQSQFTVGLIIFSLILLLYALASNPLVHLAFGFRAFGLGPFAMLPDLFTCVALFVLLYLTLKY